MEASRVFLILVLVLAYHVSSGSSEVWKLNRTRKLELNPVPEKKKKNCQEARARGRESRIQGGRTMDDEDKKTEAAIRKENQQHNKDVRY